MKKTRLYVDFEYDFELFGIASSVKFHKLCWSMNQKLGTRLVKQQDYAIENKEGRSLQFLNSLFQDDSSEFHLFKNKSPDNENDYILPELTHFDYVLKFSGRFQTFAAEEVIKQLREVRYIEYIAEISLDKIKSKDNFLS